MGSFDRVVTGYSMGQANRLLGFPSDARLLIVNTDDFGMCHSVNEAVFASLTKGVASSATLMVPCPWALHAMQFLAEHPEISFGVHLTVISDWRSYRWGPVTPKERVPTLLDGSGCFYNFEGMSELFTRVDLKQLELEFRSQIEVVLSYGLKPSHLDWHALRISNRPDISDVMFNLTREYGLALRVYGGSQIEKIQDQGLPVNDYDFLDSYLIESTNKTAQYLKRLHDLPIGLSEWAVHPGLETSELMAIDPGGVYIRQADFDFLMSQEAKETIEKEGIILLSYRALQDIWIKN